MLNLTVRHSSSCHLRRARRRYVPHRGPDVCERMRVEEAEEEEIEGEERMDEVVTPSTNGFGSDDEDMMCSELWVYVCVSVCVCV